MNISMSTLPSRVNITYSLFFFWAVSLYSVLLGFFPIHCEALGFSAYQIGLIAAAANVATLVGAPTTQVVAHHWIAPRVLLLVMPIAALLVFSSLFEMTAFLPVLLAWFTVMFFSKGAATIATAKAVRDSADGQIHFEHVRAWGSIGFIVMGFVLGQAYDHYGPRSILPLALLILIAICATALPLMRYMRPFTGASTLQREVGKASSVQSTFLRQPAFWLLVLATTLVSMSHAPLYAYFSLYLRAHEWSGFLISVAWNVGVVAEVAFFFFFPRVTRHLSLLTIFKLSVIAAAVRWLILFQCDSRVVIILSQCLHALTFGGCYLAGVKLTYLVLPEDLRDRGQGLLPAMGAGLGLILGQLGAGWLAEQLPSSEKRGFLLGSVWATF
jgi:PPP family 3-phenylpropionic acid transporter